MVLSSFQSIQSRKQKNDVIMKNNFYYQNFTALKKPTASKKKPTANKYNSRAQARVCRQLEYSLSARPYHSKV